VDEDHPISSTVHIGKRTILLSLAVKACAKRTKKLLPVALWVPL
jgi:hypothetical protein